MFAMSKAFLFALHIAWTIAERYIKSGLHPVIVDFLYTKHFCFVFPVVLFLFECVSVAVCH